MTCFAKERNKYSALMSQHVNLQLRAGQARSITFWLMDIAGGTTGETYATWTTENPRPSSLTNWSGSSAYLAIARNQLASQMVGVSGKHADNTAAFTTTYLNSSPLIGEWTLYAVCWDGVSSLKVYQISTQGTKVKTITMPNDDLLTMCLGSSVQRIGRSLLETYEARSNPSGVYFAELCAFDAQLTQAQVESLYAAGAPAYARDNASHLPTGWAGPALVYHCSLNSSLECDVVGVADRLYAPAVWFSTRDGGLFGGDDVEHPSQVESVNPVLLRPLADATQPAIVLCVGDSFEVRTEGQRADANLLEMIGTERARYWQIYTPGTSGVTVTSIDWASDARVERAYPRTLLAGAGYAGGVLTCTIASTDQPMVAGDTCALCAGATSTIRRYGKVLTCDLAGDHYDVTVEFGADPAAATGDTLYPTISLLAWESKDITLGAAAATDAYLLGQYTNENSAITATAPGGQWAFQRSRDSMRMDDIRGWECGALHIFRLPSAAGMCPKLQFAKSIGGNNAANIIKTEIDLWSVGQARGVGPGGYVAIAVEDDGNTATSFGVHTAVDAADTQSKQLTALSPIMYRRDPATGNIWLMPIAANSARWAMLDPRQAGTSNTGKQWSAPQVESLLSALKSQWPNAARKTIILADYQDQTTDAATVQAWVQNAVDGLNPIFDAHGWERPILGVIGYIPNGDGLATQARNYEATCAGMIAAARANADQVAYINLYPLVGGSQIGQPQWASGMALADGPGWRRLRLLCPFLAGSTLTVDGSYVSATKTFTTAADMSSVYPISGYMVYVVGSDGDVVPQGWYTPASVNPTAKTIVFAADVGGGADATTVKIVVGPLADTLLDSFVTHPVYPGVGFVRGARAAHEIIAAIASADDAPLDQIAAKVWAVVGRTLDGEALATAAAVAAIPTTPLLAADYVATDNASIQAAATSAASADTKLDAIQTHDQATADKDAIIAAINPLPAQNDISVEIKDISMG